MTDRLITPAAGPPAGVNLKAYEAELPLGSLVVGVDNIHHDVYLSTPFCEQTRTYLLELIRQTANITYAVQKDSRPPKGPETGAWKRQLLELLQESITRAKFEKKIELDLLARIALLKFLTQEIGAQFANLLLEAKEWIRGRGEYFERSEQAHVMKARLAEIQANRRNIYRTVGQHIYQILAEIEENQLGRARRALFGEEQSGAYDMLNNRIVFVESGRDDALFLEQYVLLGNYQRDVDRLETLNAFFLEFLASAQLAGGRNGALSEAGRTHQALLDSALATRNELAKLEEQRAALSRRLDRGGGVFARVGIGADSAQLRAELSEVEMRLKQLQKKLEGFEPRIESAKTKADFFAEEYQGRLGDYLNEPENAQRLFDARWTGELNTETAAVRARLLEDWLARLEQRDLLVHILASYELRNFYHDYCPPSPLAAAEKGAGVARGVRARGGDSEAVSGAAILHWSASKHSRRSCGAIRARKRAPWPCVSPRTSCACGATLRNYERLAAAMERIQLVRSERTRELSRHEQQPVRIPAALRGAPRAGQRREPRGHQGRRARLDAHHPGSAGPRP